MSHLSIERLAALADDAPTPMERQHLELCADCAQEVTAHRAVLEMASAERAAMAIPLTRWESLSQRLREEQLIASEPVGSVTAEWAAPIGRRRLSTRAMLRAAAAIVLVASGTLIGRASAGATLLPGGLTGESAQQMATRPFSPDRIPTTFASVEDALAYRRAAESAYNDAVAFLAVHDSVASLAETPAAMRTRLSALDRVSRTMREALEDAPYDPVINSFYLNSFGQREATLRQLNAVLPQSSRLNGF